jgi:hypothetical protein
VCCGWVELAQASTSSPSLSGLKATKTRIFANNFAGVGFTRDNGTVYLSREFNTFSNVLRIGPRNGLFSSS